MENGIPSDEWNGWVFIPMEFRIPLEFEQNSIFEFNGIPVEFYWYSSGIRLENHYIWNSNRIPMEFQSMKKQNSNGILQEFY